MPHFSNPAAARVQVTVRSHRCPSEPLRLRVPRFLKNPAAARVQVTVPLLRPSAPRCLRVRLFLVNPAAARVQVTVPLLRPLAPLFLQVQLLLVNLAAARVQVTAMLRLIRHLLAFQSSTGNEIRCISTRSQSRASWQEILPAWFFWTTVLSVPWRQKTPINLAEARARQLAIRWRSRDAQEHNRRHIHLLDSQVTLANATKGRSGSMRQQHILWKSHATSLAAHFRAIHGYCRSENNPSDAASRDVKGWRLHSKLFRAVQQELKRKVAPRLRRVGTRAEVRPRHK